MRCHYIKDKIAGRVLIPCCWETLRNMDIGECCCPKSEKSNEQRIEILEKFMKEQLKKGVTK